MLTFWLFQCSLPLILFEMGVHALKVEKRLRSRKQGRELYSFTFSNEDQIDWVKPNKEFRRKGKLYDVESRKDSAGFITFVVHADTKEDKLIASLHQSASRSSSGSGALVKKWHEIKLFSGVVSEAIEISFYSGFKHRLQGTLLPDQIYKGVQVPPPELI